jgi:hypothetical protein
MANHDKLLSQSRTKSWAIFFLERRISIRITISQTKVVLYS